MTTPERIWIMPSFAQQARGIGDWMNAPWAFPSETPYILATPEALAASPEGQALIAAAEARGWNAAIEAGVVALQAETGSDDDHPAVCEFRAIKKGE